LEFVGFRGEVVAGWDLDCTGVSFLIEIDASRVLLFTEKNEILMIDTKNGKELRHLQLKCRITKSRNAGLLVSNEHILFSTEVGLILFDFEAFTIVKTFPERIQGELFANSRKQLCNGLFLATSAYHTSILQLTDDNVINNTATSSMWGTPIGWLHERFWSFVNVRVGSVRVFSYNKQGVQQQSFFVGGIQSPRTTLLGNTICIYDVHTSTRIVLVTFSNRNNQLEPIIRRCALRAQVEWVVGTKNDELIVKTFNNVILLLQPSPKGIRWRELGPVSGVLFAYGRLYTLSKSKLTGKPYLRLWD
jgi:hypothetical protein